MGNEGGVVLLDNAALALGLLFNSDVFGLLGLLRGGALHVHLVRAAVSGGAVLGSVHGFGSTLENGARCFGLRRRRSCVGLECNNN